MREGGMGWHGMAGRGWEGLVAGCGYARRLRRACSSGSRPSRSDVGAATSSLGEGATVVDGRTKSSADGRRS